MNADTQQRRRSIVTTLILCITAMLCCEKVRAQSDKPSEDVAAIVELLQANNALDNAIWQAESKEERAQLIAKREAKQKDVRVELLTLAKKHPGTTGGLAALYWAAFIPHELASGETAPQLFQEQAATAGLEQIAAAISLGRSGSSEAGGNLEIADCLLNRVKENLDDDKAAEVLIAVCRLSMGSDDDQDPAPTFVQAADVLASRFATSPDICNFCEILESRSWAQPFERHLRTILRSNQHRAVRCAAAFALPAVIQLPQGKRQVEAAKLYEQFLNDFDGEFEYSFQSIEKDWRLVASRELNRLKVVPMGGKAPEILGIDLDGQPLALSDYRGKVVLLSFWATWCAPCLELIPHEREMAERYAGDSFAIVGINGDSDVKQAQMAVAKNDITWKSLRDEREGERKISERWSIHGWPTLCLIDQEGVIRRRWSRYLSVAEIDVAIAQLIDGKTP
jgi:thiol-disulfide isomerase/thioredoxin